MSRTGRPRAGTARGAEAGRTRRRQAAPARIDRWVKIRICIAGSLLSLLFLAIAYKAYALQIREAAKYRRLAQRQHLRTVEVPAPRGAIVDAQGRELAGTAAADSVFANPRDVRDVSGTAEALAAILDLDLRALEAKLSSRRYFVWLARHVTERQARAVKRAKLRGIFLTSEPRRFYPGKSLAGPVLGFAGVDGDGLDGIELEMNELLAGKQARFAAVRDASGHIMMADGMVKPESGATISLTLDRAIQYIAEQALEEVVVANDAKAGTLVVLDVADGSVLAMANWPTYDPNAPGSRKARNRAITDAFEIGSVMKVFTIAAAIDAGAVQVGESIDVEKGRLKVGRKIIRDTYRDAILTIGGVIKRSSNVGAVKIAQRLGRDRLHRALLDYGFASRSGIELPGERSGRIRNPRNWGDVGLASLSFGYGITSTTLQVAAGFAAIGNGGTYHDPRIVREIRDSSDSLIYRHRPEGRRIMKASTADALLPMLASVFDKGRFGGTARSLDSPSFDVGGKTGTARKVDPETRQYSRELYVSSFAGLAPIDKPRIAVVVVVDEPRGEHYYGGRVAGPAFVRVVDETLRYLGVPPKTAAAGKKASAAAATGDDVESRLPAIDDVVESAGLESAEGAADPSPSAESTGHTVEIPDFRGIGLGRALDLARSAGIPVEITGSGRVVRQSPGPGPAPWPGECHLVLSPARPPALENP